MSNLPDSDQVTLEQTRNLELSPFIPDEIEGHDFRLRPRRAISLWPSLTEDEQFLCLEHAPWSLDVFATTRAELFSELKEQMLMLWREYAREEDEALSEPAQQVKRQLLADWEEATRNRSPGLIMKSKFFNWLSNHSHRWLKNHHLKNQQFVDPGERLRLHKLIECPQLLPKKQ